NGFTLRDVAETFRRAGVLWVNSSAWSRQAGYLAGLWDRVQGTPWEDFAKFVGSRERQEALRAQLGKELERVGIPMRDGFFNKPYVPDAATTDARLPIEATAVEVAPGSAVDVPLAGPRLWMSA